jgi:hypothetical protein
VQETLPYKRETVPRTKGAASILERERVGHTQSGRVPRLQILKMQEGLVVELQPSTSSTKTPRSASMRGFDNRYKTSSANTALKFCFHGLCSFASELDREASTRTLRLRALRIRIENSEPLQATEKRRSSRSPIRPKDYQMLVVRLRFQKERRTTSEARSLYFGTMPSSSLQRVQVRGGNFPSAPR